MAILQQLLFTASNGSSVNNLPLDIGTGNATEDIPGSWTITSNRARIGTTGSSFRFPNIATANFTIRAVVRLLNTTPDPILTLNGRTSAFGINNRWTVLLDVANGIRIRKTVGGTNTVKQTAAFSWSTGVDYAVQFALNGSTKQVWVDGTKIAEDLGDTDLSTGDNIFLSTSISPAGTATTGWHIDTLEVDDAFPSAPTGGNAPRSMRYHLSSINR